MRVNIFEFDGWQVDYQPRKGHVFSRGRDRILVRRNKDGTLAVQRSWLDRTANLSPAPYGSTSGGEQGGDGIELFPRWTRDNRLAMDGTAMRHDVGYFTPDGMPTLGDGKRYPLAARNLANGYERYDGSHYIRAYRHAVAQWKKDRDPFARMWLILCAFDVIRRWPLVGFADGEGPEYSLAAMEQNVAASPHLGALGITRENAWGLRCVVEAYRASQYPLFRTWIDRFVRMVEVGQAANGAIERHTKASGLQQGEPWGMFNLPDYAEVCVSWQTPFLVVAVNEARKLVPECTESARTIMARIQAWWHNVELVPGDVYDGIPTNPGLPRYLVVAINGNLDDYISEGVGPARSQYDGYAFEAFKEIGL